MHSKILFYIFKAKNSLKKIQEYCNPIANKPIKRRKSKIQPPKKTHNVQRNKDMYE